MKLYQPKQPDVVRVIDILSQPVVAARMKIMQLLDIQLETAK
jgi:hypothetical protein